MGREERYILGIHDGHNCGATLTRGGLIVACISEERLSRRKNSSGYPRQAIEAVLRLAGIDSSEISEIVYASNFMHAADYLQDIARWYAVGMAQQIADLSRSREYERIVFEQRKKARVDIVVDHLGIPSNRVSFVEHHLAHAAAAYFTAPKDDHQKPLLCLTCDGAGDGISATVSIGHGNSINRLSATDRHASLGKIYSRVTFLMGMTPWEHEYKIMGLAPYADPEHAKRAAKPLEQLLGLSTDGLAFQQRTELSMNYCYEYLRNAFERVRFDTVAGAIQLFTENLLIDWVRSCIKRTGIRDVVCGGGVFMNVKANMLISELPEVRSIYIMPSSADESLSIGACLYRYYEKNSDSNHDASRLTHLYFGGADDAQGEAQAIELARKSFPADITRPPNMEEAIAKLLAKDEIVAVCRGAMEWGARALGNRSILSSADNFSRVDEINTMIKHRDFWMPFAPSIKAESVDQYMELSRKFEPLFMTVAVRSKPSGYSHLIAASHPRDRTIRPQLVTAAANPSYYKIIDLFEQQTGRGVILNTSFNLHGEPIVASAKDAVRVMAHSGIRHLALNEYLISKVSLREH